jgi:uncharacterized membrane protein
MRFFNALRPEVVFAAFAAFFGVLMLILTPPFQSPDEMNHLYRAYQISKGNLSPIRQDNRLGGYIPNSLVKIAEPFSGLCWNMHTKTNYQTITQGFNIPLNPERTTFTDFPNTSMYSPVAYLPQSISIFLSRNLHVSALSVFYGARLFALLFWIIILFFSIRIIPFYQWFFVFIALLPMSVFINMTLSADVVTNAISFFTIAYILKLACGNALVSRKNLAILLLLLALLTSCKVLYTPIFMLILLIPKAKFGTTKTYWKALSILSVAALGFVLFWSKVLNSLYIPYSDYNVMFRDHATLIKSANMHLQMQYISHHGMYLLQVFAHSMKSTFDMYFEGYIGTLGWLETKLPLWFIYLSYTVLFFVAIANGNKEITINLRGKIILAGIVITIICLILLSQHLTWDEVGGDTIATIQGRYFIPVFPLLFMLFYNAKWSKPTIVVPVVVFFSLFSLSLTAKTIYTRYYVAPIMKSTTITCNAESITSDNLFQTNLPAISLENANARSSEKAHSGSYSIKLSHSNPYGFTYRIYKARTGDIIRAEVWRLGQTGGIIIQGGANSFYCSSSKIIETGNNGWRKIEALWIVPKDMYFNEIGIYLYNDSPAASYFDDITIQYKTL